MAENQVRQNFHEETEVEINQQINRELYASYVYLSMVRKMFLFSKLQCALVQFMKQEFNSF